MVGNAFEAAALLGLIGWGMALIVTILHDVHRHPPVLIPAPEHGGAMTAQGVPYVPGGVAEPHGVG